LQRTFVEWIDELPAQGRTSFEFIAGIIEAGHL
jgi:hypothetical protein